MAGDVHLVAYFAGFFNLGYFIGRLHRALVNNGFYKFNRSLFTNLLRRKTRCLDKHQKIVITIRWQYPCGAVGNARHKILRKAFHRA